MQDPDSLIPGRTPDLSPSIADEIASVDARRKDLLFMASARVKVLLDELAALCRVVGPVTREELPAGILRRRSTKEPARAPRAKKKTEEAANAGA